MAASCSLSQSWLYLLLFKFYESCSLCLISWNLWNQMNNYQDAIVRVYKRCCKKIFFFFCEPFFPVVSNLQCEENVSYASNEQRRRFLESRNLTSDKQIFPSSRGSGYVPWQPLLGTDFKACLSAVPHALTQWSPGWNVNEKTPVTQWGSSSMQKPQALSNEPFLEYLSMFWFFPLGQLLCLILQV